MVKTPAFHSSPGQIPLYYKRHLASLAAAVLVIIAFNAFNVLAEPFLPSFAVYGALHASTVVLALAPPARPQRKFLFILCSAALNAGVLYAGILSLELLGGVPAALRLYLGLGVCALFGAIAYGLLNRAFWFPSLRPRAIVKIAIGCLLAALLALLVENSIMTFGSWWFVAVWWFAFSLGLCGALERTKNLGFEADA